MKLSINPILYQFRRPREICGSRKIRGFAPKDDDCFEDCSDFVFLCGFFGHNPHLRNGNLPKTNSFSLELIKILINNPDLIYSMSEEIFQSVIIIISAIIEDNQDLVEFENVMATITQSEHGDGEYNRSIRNERHEKFLDFIAPYKKSINIII